MAVWESLPVWGFIPVFLVPPHIRLVAPPYQGPQEVIAAIIGWGHWVKWGQGQGHTGSLCQKRTLGPGTRSRAMQNEDKGWKEDKDKVTLDKKKDTGSEEDMSMSLGHWVKRGQWDKEQGKKKDQASMRTRTRAIQSKSATKCSPILFYLFFQSLVLTFAMENHTFDIKFWKCKA